MKTVYAFFILKISRRGDIVQLILLLWKKGQVLCLRTLQRINVKWTLLLATGPICDNFKAAHVPHYFHGNGKINTKTLTLQLYSAPELAKLRPKEVFLPTGITSINLCRPQRKYWTLAQLFILVPRTHLAPN